MSVNYIFESERLGFRRWTDNDREPFAKMNADQEVMEFMPKCLTSEESNAFIPRIEEHFNTYGFGLWAVDIKETGTFIGYIGFFTAVFQAEFTPCIEIGWRLNRKSWNNGYATEGAKACLKYGYEELSLDEVYSFTSELNLRSIKVMKKIGLKEAGCFEHPNVKEGNPLKPHVLYHLKMQ